MLIDFLTSCASVVKVPSYSTVSPNLLKSYYSIKTDNDIKSWKFYNTTAVSSASIVIMSTDTKRLKEIFLDVVGVDDTTIKIETSIDYSNWEELPYKVDTVYPTKHLYKVINNIGGYQTVPVSAKYFNCTLGAIESNPPSGVIDNFRYAYTKFNTYSKETGYIYDNLEWKFLKITFTDLSDVNTNNPLFITNLKIMIEEEFETSKIDSNLLELKSTIFTQSKVFDEQEFIPDMVKNFMKMIEDKNMLLNNINFVSCIVNTNAATDSTLEGIGNDFIGIDTVIYP